MRNRTKIVVVGSSNTDMVVKSATLPRPGETVIGGTFLLAPGGKGANQAVAAARLGAEVTFIARVGDDMFGRQALDGYRREGIDTSFIVQDAENATGVALILVDEKGENTISVASGANTAMKPSDVEAAGQRIAAADIVVSQLETPLDVLECAADLANKHGIPFLLDPAPARALPDEFLRKITYIKPNEHEAEMLCAMPVHDEASAVRAAEKLLAFGMRGVVVTLGAQGALTLRAGSTPVHVGPYRVTATDTTAAGDAFSGALALRLAEGRSLEESARFANAVAAVSTRHMGAQPSLPTMEDVREFIREQG